MRRFVVNLLLILMTATSAHAEKKVRMPSCEEVVAAPAEKAPSLTKAESYSLQLANFLYSSGQFPSSRNMNMRLGVLGLGFEDLVSDFEITKEEWDQVARLKVERKLAFLGTASFPGSLDRATIDDKSLDEDQRETLLKINQFVNDVREKLRSILTAQEVKSLTESNRFLNSHELEDHLQRLTLDAQYTLDQLLGRSTKSITKALHVWRHRLLVEQPKLREKLTRKMKNAFKSAVDAYKEIAEDDEEILRQMAQQLKVQPRELQAFMGEQAIFPSVTALVDESLADNPEFFKAFVNRRVFTKVRRDKLIKAVREADEILLFKLAENQDLGNFEEIVALAEELNAPIIISPAFSEPNNIISRLGYLLEHPRVHLMVDPILQINKDFYVVNNGSPDKIMDPLTGLEQIFDPTQNVVVFHPRVKTKSRGSGYYDALASFLTTTGSMSIAAYRSKFQVGMTTDFRTQLAVENDRGLTILSRRYRNPAVNAITGGGHYMMARRASFAQARYGNPEGLFDLGKLYTAEGVKKLDVIPGIVLGDIHAGITDSGFQWAFFQGLIKLGVLEKKPNVKPGEFPYQQGPVKVATFVLQELVDGLPFNEHTLGRLLTRSHMDKNGDIDVAAHFQHAAHFYNMLMSLFPESIFVVPPDNHGHDWIIKAMQKANFQDGGQRPADAEILMRLITETIQQGGNPYARIMRFFGLYTDRVVFLSPDDQYRIAWDPTSTNPFSLLNGVEIGQHSQYGMNGAKSISLKGLLMAYSANVTGHTHDTAEDGRSKKVGTLAPTRQSYHAGPSKNSASIALVYSEEAIQMLVAQPNGIFVPDAPSQPPEKFFQSPELPRIRPWPQLPEGGTTTDQYRSSPPQDRQLRGN